MGFPDDTRGGAGRPPAGALRIGDRERDEVMRILHDAFAQGRITREELDERLDTTLAARTEEDLRRVTSDLLPGFRAAAPPPGPPYPWQHHHRHGHHGYGHPAAWRPYAAAWGPPHAAHWAGARRPRVGPPVLPIVAAVVLVVAFVSGHAWPLFLVAKLLFLAWLVTTVLRLARHRHRPHRSRIGP
ncbi:DUF1707 SHOCT-like domain-containing protein [Microbispora amethystogenes]|uniref:DUF1707 domain-containing protein n=1 Tax=Microbispora amethystogenes TaxID=1427754 RepID=A0ABQ4FBK8_9ACTN|nr:DUF1707 domain-containing protein [Microbispora amethystogenes]GIH32118.1 hypothetical protein Mam01_22820 [Microbispora amethystogenes]